MFLQIDRIGNFGRQGAVLGRHEQERVDLNRFWRSGRKGRGIGADGIGADRISRLLSKRRGHDQDQRRRRGRANTVPEAFRFQF